MDVERSRVLARAALQNLEAHRKRIDDLNVYPVPDGDTGTNLTLTVRAIVEAFDNSTAAGPEALAKELSRAALMGARGNSGVIFSQIVRGFAEALGRHDDVDGEVLAEAFRSASDAAYRAVRRPVEGTMLTVVREMAEAAERDDVRSLPREEAFARIVAAGEEAVARTPELLQVLADAGVVDAGGAGLVEIVRGIAAGVSGEALPAVPVEGEGLSFDAIHQELSEFRYCTVFVVEGENLDADALEAELERLGDSLLVVGDASALKVHVHTDAPGTALGLGTRIGTIEGVEIANMHKQTTEREERLSGEPEPDQPMRATAVVAVVAGDGNAQLYRENAGGAVRIVHGGQTMNPSADEIRRAIEEAPGEAVIVLPNNGNVIASAEIAVEAAAKPARVVPTRSVPAGLSLLVGFDPDADLETNERELREALESVSTGEITVARRSVEVDGVPVREGAWFGLVDDRAVACDDDFDAVVDAVVERLLGEGGRSVVTALVGAEGPDEEALRARLEELHPGVDVEVQRGGQPHYPLLLSAE